MPIKKVKKIKKKTQIFWKTRNGEISKKIGIDIDKEKYGEIEPL